MLKNWRNWIAAFDAAATHDDWGSLRPFLTEDVTYTVSGVPFACHLVGMDAVLSGFQKSISNFDRHFDERQWYGVGVREYAPDIVTGRAMGVYRMKDLPLLHFSAPSIWRFENGKITMMQDCYDLAEADVQDALDWLEQHAPTLDASYI